MAISSRELWLIIRARDESSRTLRSVGQAFGKLGRELDRANREYVRKSQAIRKQTQDVRRAYTEQSAALRNNTRATVASLRDETAALRNNVRERTGLYRQSVASTKDAYNQMIAARRSEIASLRQSMLARSGDLREQRHQSREQLAIMRSGHQERMSLLRSMHRQEVSLRQSNLRAVNQPLQQANAAMRTQIAENVRNLNRLTGTLTSQQRAQAAQWSRQIDENRIKIAKNNEQILKNQHSTANSLAGLRARQAEQVRAATDTYNRDAAAHGAAANQQINNLQRLNEADRRAVADRMSRIQQLQRSRDTAAQGQIRQMQQLNNADRATIASREQQIRQVQRATDTQIQQLGRVRDAQLAALRNEQNMARQAHQLVQARVQQMQQLIGRVQQYSQSLVMAGTALIFLGGMGVKFFQTSSKAALDWGKQVAWASTQVDDATLTFDEMSKEAKKVASEVPVAFEEMGQLMFDVLSTLNPVMREDFPGLIKAFSMAAVAGQADLRASSLATMNIINAWHLGMRRMGDEWVRTSDVAETAGIILDKQFRTIQLGTGTYEELTKSLGRAIPPFAAFNQNVDTLLGSWALLTRMGLSPAMAMTSAARAMELFARPQNVRQMKAMGIAVTDNHGRMLQLNEIIRNMVTTMDLGNKSGSELAEVIQNLWGQRQGTIQARRFLTLAIQNIDEFDNFIERISNAEGDMRRAYETILEQPQAQLELLKNRWQVLRIEIGEALIPTISKLTTVVGGMLDAWLSLDEQTRDNIVKFAALAAVISTVLGMGLLITGMLGFATSGLMMITGSAAGAVAALLNLGLAFGVVSAALILGVRYWDQLKPIVEYLRQYLPQIATALLAVAAAVAVAKWHLAALNGTTILTGASFAKLAGTLKALPLLLIAGLFIRIADNMREAKAAAEAYTATFTKSVDSSNMETILNAERRLTEELVREQRRRADLLREHQGEPWLPDWMKELNVRIDAALPDWMVIGPSKQDVANAFGEASARADAMTAEIDRLNLSYEQYLFNVMAMRSQYKSFTQEELVALAAANDIDLTQPWNDVKGPIADVIHGARGANAQIARTADEAYDASEGMKSLTGELDAFSQAGLGLTERQKAIKSALEAIVDPGAAFVQVMDGMSETLEKQKRTLDTSREGFAQYIKEGIFNLNDFADALEKQMEAATAFGDNMRTISETISRRFGKDVAESVTDALLMLGEDAPALAAALVADLNSEAFDRVAENLPAAIEAQNALAVIELERSISMFAELGSAIGIAIAEGIIAGFGLTPPEVAVIVNRIQSTITGGLNPILEGIGKPLIADAPVRAQAHRTVRRMSASQAMRSSGPRGDNHERIGENMDALAAFSEGKANAGIGSARIAMRGFMSRDDLPGVPDTQHLGTWLGPTVSGPIQYTLDAVGEFLDSLSPTLGAGVGWQTMWNVVKSMFPGVQLHSGLRPGAITATGNQSYHALGRAIDITPSMAIFNWLAQHYPHSRELIFSPAGGRQIRNGANHVYSGITKAMHYDHIHWAMAQGGLVTQPTFALIGEAGPEVVIPLDQLQGLLNQMVLGQDAATGGLGSIQGLLSAIGSQAQARDQLLEAYDSIARLRSQIVGLQQEYVDVQSALAAAWREARKITLEEEKAIIGARQNVRAREEALARMRRVGPLERELEILRQQERVQSALKALEDARSGGGTSIDQAALAEAQAALTAAQFELARVATLPSTGDEVRDLLRRYEAEYNLAQAQRTLQDLMPETANQTENLRILEIELALAQDALNVMMQQGKNDLDDLRLAEIEVALARQNLTQVTADAIGPTDEVNRLTERSAAIQEELRNALGELPGAINSARDAHFGMIDSTLGLVSASRELLALEPAGVQFFQHIAQAAGLTTQAIRDITVQAQHIATNMNPNILMARAGGARYFQVAGTDDQYLRTSWGAWYNATGPGQKDALKRLFGSPTMVGRAAIGPIAGAVMDLFGGPGGMQDVLAGRAALPRLARGGNVLHSGWAMVGENGPEVRWLPQGAQVRPLDSPVGDQIIIQVEEGAVKVTVEGTSSDAQEIQQAIDESLDDFLRRLVTEMRSK